MFKNDAFLWYNVGDWKDLGLAVPNFGNDPTSVNDTIRYLTEVTGRNLQAVMFHPDSRLRTPPSVNTLIRLHKLCTRARVILAGRAVPNGTPNMESIHTNPAPEAFLAFPVPYFKVRNPWLKQYCGLVMTAISEAWQHQENAKPIEISQAFAGLFGQYIQRVYRLMSTELLAQDPAKAADPAFTLLDDSFKAYDPTKFFTSTELIDTVPDFDDIPTEDDLEVLTNGIVLPSLPTLPRYPSGNVVSITSPATPAPVSFAPAPVG